MQYLLSEEDYKVLKEKEKMLDEVQLYVKKRSRPHYQRAYGNIGVKVSSFEDGTTLDINLVKLFEMLGFDFQDGLHIEMKSEWIG